MNRTLKAITNWFSNLTYSRKFNVITLIFVLPIIAFLPLVQNQTARIDQYGTQELFGTLYLRPLWRLTDTIQTHQLVSEQYLNGDVEFSQVAAAQQAVDAEFNTYEFVQSQEVLSLELRSDEKNIKDQWFALKTSVENGDPADVGLLHTNLLESIRLLVARVGDYSNLILDPDLDTYYVMDSVLLKLPENQSVVFEIHQMALTRARGQALTAEDETRLQALFSRLALNLNTMDRNINVARNNTANPEITALAPAPLAEYESALQTYLEFINAAGLTNTTSEAGVLNAKLVAEFEKARQTNLTFYDSASAGLQSGVSARVNSLILQFYIIALVALASVAGAFLLGQSIMSAISQPLYQLAETSQKLAAGDLTARVATESTDELGKVARAFNQMASELEADKSSLVARATELESAKQISEKRAQDLQSISEISRAITSEQKLNALLPLIVRLVSEKFKYYHTGIFLMDDRRDYAVLEAANSEGGKRMLKRVHRLRVGTGIVGYAAATSLPRIALDVEADAVFFDNPDLPQTRSEMALPLRVSGATIGVLDVQSTEPNAFGEGDIATLSTLADQVAIAIQNSRNFEAAQSFIENAQRTAGVFLKDSWQILRSQEQLAAYYGVAGDAKSIGRPVDSEIMERIKIERKPIVSHGKIPRLAVPIQLGDMVVGIVNVQLPEGHRWDQDEIDITNAVADRLSLALESTTLLEATQRRAEIERLTSDIASRIGATTRFDSILQTAAEELSRALGGSDVLVQIQAGTAKENDERAAGAVRKDARLDQ